MVYLNKQDYEDINKLLNIIHSIKNIYDELIILEQSNKKDSFEYDDYLNKLNSNLILEDNIFNRLTKNEEKIYSIISFLNNNIPKSPTVVLYDSLLNIEDKNIIKIRLLNSLAFKSLQSEFVIKISDNDISIKTKILYNLYLFIYKDIINLALAICDKEIKIKYDLIFLFKIFEKEMLEDKFKINDSPFLINECVISFYPFARERLTDLKNCITSRIMLDQLDTLLNKDNLYFMNYNNISKTIVRQAIIRATMVISSDYVRNDIIETFEEVINDEDLLNCFSIRVIKDALSYVEQDKKTPQYVYFKKI